LASPSVPSLTAIPHRRCSPSRSFFLSPTKSKFVIRDQCPPLINRHPTKSPTPLLFCPFSPPSPIPWTSAGLHQSSFRRPLNHCLPFSSRRAISFYPHPRSIKGNKFPRISYPPFFIQAVLIVFFFPPFSVLLSLNYAYFASGRSPLVFSAAFFWSPALNFSRSPDLSPGLRRFCLFFCAELDKSTQSPPNLSPAFPDIQPGHSCACSAPFLQGLLAFYVSKGLRDKSTRPTWRQNFCLTGLSGWKPSPQSFPSPQTDVFFPLPLLGKPLSYFGPPHTKSSLLLDTSCTHPAASPDCNR